MTMEFTGYSDGDVDTNHTDLPTLNEIVSERYSRRAALRGGVSATLAAAFGSSLLAACGDDDGSGPTTQTLNAGDDVTVMPGTQLTLVGTAVGVTGANFTQTGGPALDLTTSGSNVTFTAPGVAQSTEFTFTLTGGGMSDAVVVTVLPATLNFTAIPKNKNDVVTVPAGYKVAVVTALGDPIASGVAAYRNDGTDTNFAQRIGDHGDALYYFGLNAAGARDDGSSTRGLLVQNHENLNVQYLHPQGPSPAPRPEGEVLKEIEAHGVSVVELLDAGNRNWAYVQGSSFNRRITPFTPTVFHGPVRGSAFLQTAFSPAGTDGRGTINNCANGHADWGTLLTCEENWAGYFRRNGDDANRTARELTALRRYGVTSSSGNYAWSSAPTTNSGILRWDARAKGANATADYRNEPNQFGWVVEIDPYNPTATPRKRTALGRFGHEGAWLGRLTPGQKVAVYMGDDSRREYLYKYVSSASWSAADAQAADRLAVGDKYLDDGILHVARFNADGTGIWIPLTFGKVPARPAVGAEPAYTFADQADILINARLAADAVGATPMDRPEWTAVNPATGEVYLTLTNNNASNRPINDTNAANPRHYVEPVGTGTTSGNPNGHIIRLREMGDDNASTAFNWDIYLFGADSADAGQNVNISGLDDSNDFSSPDGLYFSRAQNAAGQGKPLLWIQTDDGAFTDRTNNQMLAALPGNVGDGGAVTITNTAANGTTADQRTIVGTPATGANLKRFLTGPLECEITGVDTTPDGQTLFVGIQHPGEDGDASAPTSNWPQSQSGTKSGRPRSGVVAITKQNGGIVGI